jgi:hypothetical protein
MKTQVIHLDPHDDVISVHDKLAWAKSTRILLVYPRRSRILTRSLDLRLIQRQAAALGVQLAIVASLQEIQDAARELGIPVYRSPADAQRRSWPGVSHPSLPHFRFVGSELREMRKSLSPQEPRWRRLVGVRLAFFALAVLAVLVLLALFLPSATVRVVPATRTQTLAIPASAGPAVTTVSLSGSLPARRAYASVEGSKTSTVTGSLTIPDAAAAGMVRFRNLTTGVIGIPAGTIVRTQGDVPVRFATTNDAVVAAGVGKTMDVPVQAVRAGASGNLPADVLVAIEGDLGPSLAVTNPSPTSGGADTAAPVQTEADRTGLQAALEAELLVRCEQSLRASLAEGDLLFPDTLKVGQVLAATFFPAEDQTGDTLSLTLKIQCQGEYAAAADIQTLAGLALDANLPDGYIPASSGLTAPPAVPPVTDAQGVSHWEIQAVRGLQARLDPLAVVNLIAGRKPVEAARRLQSVLALAAPPAIRVTPKWWPWLPVIPFRIHITVGG